MNEVKRERRPTAFSIAKVCQRFVILPSEMVTALSQWGQVQLKTLPITCGGRAAPQRLCLYAAMRPPAGGSAC